MSDQSWIDATIVGVSYATIAAAAGALTFLAAISIVLVRLRRRRLSSEGIKLDNPTAILEEMRKRLEDLPTLPQFATRFGDELPLQNPFAEPDPEPIAIVAPDPIPAPLPSRISAPPLPTNAEDPITGEPDEEAYRAWLREWLVFAEQYGDETTDDPIRASESDEPGQLL